MRGRDGNILPPPPPPLPIVLRSVINTGPSNPQYWALILQTLVLSRNTLYLKHYQYWAFRGERIIRYSNIIQILEANISIRIRATF